MTAYLVRCARCDRAFWQAERAAPVPEHSRWDRRIATAARTGAEDRCEGSAQPGYWIAEGAGPLRWRERQRTRAPGTVGKDAHNG